jgi:hypothetical protein
MLSATGLRIFCHLGHAPPWFAVSDIRIDARQTKVSASPNVRDRFMDGLNFKDWPVHAEFNEPIGICQ